MNAINQNNSQAVQELRGEFTQLDADLQKRNSMLAAAGFTAFVVGAVFLALGGAFTCAPLMIVGAVVLCATPMASIAIPLASLNRNAQRALENEKYIQFMDTHRLPLNRKTD